MLRSRRQFLITTGLGASAVALEGCAPGAPQASESSSALTAASGTIPVVNVDDPAYPSLQAAADAVGEGGILYFPEGEHVVEAPVSLRPGTWVLGAGRGSVLRRAGSAVAVFRADGATGLRFSDLAFDVDVGARPGAAAISLTSVAARSGQIRVERCEFFTRSAAPAGSTGVAIAVAGASGLWIVDNHVVGLDLVASSRWLGPAVFVTRNHVVAAPQAAIGLFLNAADDALEGAIVADNLIESPGRRGIHVGAPWEGQLVERIVGLVVRNNLIRGAWGAGAVGMLARIAADSRDWIVEGNVLDNAATVDQTIGIRISAEHPSARLRSLAVLHNAVRNTDLAGIAVSGVGAGLRVSGNRLERTRGIAVSASVQAIVGAIISGNAVRGGPLVVDAVNADIESVRVCDNVCIGASGWDSAGIAVGAAAGRRVRADVTGNRCTDDQPVKGQHWGIRESGPGTFVTRYLGNDLRGNLHGPLLGINAAAVVRDNAGAPTEASGTVTFPSGATSSTIAHGLAFTPALADVSLTLVGVPGSWISSNGGQIRIAATGPNNLEIQCSPQPLSGEVLTVAWRATVRSA